MQRVGQQPHSSPLQRPQTHLLRREGAEIRCRTLGSCSLHPSSVPALGTRQYPAVPSSLIFHSSRLKPDREFISTVEGPWDKRLPAVKGRQKQAETLLHCKQTPKKGKEGMQGRSTTGQDRRSQCHNLQPNRSPVLYLWGALGTGSAVTTPPPNTGLQLPCPDPVAQGWS